MLTTKDIEQIRSCRKQLEVGFVDIPTIQKILEKVDPDSKVPPASGKRRTTKADLEAKYSARFKMKHPELYK